MSITAYMPRRRSQLIQGKTDREWIALQHEEEITNYTLDFSDHETVRVDSDTIASVAIEANGVTVDSTAPTVTSNAVTVKVTGTGGHIKATATTTTSGEKVVRKIFFQHPNETDRDDDYRASW